jgi:hypothetical protein
MLVCASTEKHNRNARSTELWLRVESCTSSRALGGAIALRCCSPLHPFDSDVRRFQQARGNELTLTENGMKQSGRTRRRVPVTVSESNPTVSDGGLVLVAPVSCQVTLSSGPPTVLFTYTKSAHGQPRVQKKMLAVPIPNPWGAL